MEQILLQAGALGVFALALWKLHERCHDELRQTRESFMDYLKEVAERGRNEDAAGRERHLKEHEAFLHAVSRLLDVVSAEGK